MSNATLDQVFAFIEANNKSNRNSRGEFRDDIKSYFCDALASLSNTEARLAMQWIKDGHFYRVGVLVQLLLQKEYSDAALEHAEVMAARERAWQAA